MGKRVHRVEQRCSSQRKKNNKKGKKYVSGVSTRKKLIRDFEDEAGGRKGNGSGAESGQKDSQIHVFSEARSQVFLTGKVKYVA